MSKNFYCGGLYPLIGILSSKLVEKEDNVYYLRYTKEGWLNPNEKNEKWLIELISNVFGSNIIFSPLYTDTNKPNFSIKDGDYVSENLIGFLKKDIKKSNIYCIAEGSSGLRHLYFDTWWLRGEVLNNRNFNYILFDDFEGVIGSFKKYNVEVIKFDLLKKGMDILKNAISIELNFDFDQFEYIFCPFLLHELEEQFDDLKLMNQTSKILIKKHPSDFRDYSQFLNNKFTLLDELFDLIPVELFFLNNFSNFIGFYSTATLFIPISRVKILNITSNRIINFLKKEASYIFRINEKRKLKYNLND